MNMTISNENAPSQLFARPRGVTWLAVGVLIIAVFHLLRLAQAIVQWHLLADLRSFLPFYLAISGAVWGVLGLFLAWALWRGCSWAPWAARWAALLFAAHYWIDRLLVQTGAGRSANTIFVAVSTVILVGCVFWILSRRKASLFFGALHVDQPKNKTVT